MSCQSWWCGCDPEIELGRAPDGSRLVLACGCAVERRGLAHDAVAVTFDTVMCDEHRAARPETLASGTRVRLDLLASLLADNR